MAGRISLLVSPELKLLASAARQLDKSVASRINRETRRVAEPVWREEVRGRVTTRLQTRVLSDTARVAVSRTNVTVKAATVGVLSSGTPTARLAGPTEFGAAADRRVSTKSRRGKAYRRRLGTGFGPKRRQGNAVFGAVSDSAARLASLWLQTAVRTTAETFEKGS